MRIRSTKPEFWNSKRIAAVSWDARFVLKALESYVDDNGVGKDDIELIVSDLFPRDHFREPSRTVARVSEAISELHRGGLVWRYGHEGTDLLYLSFWEQSQRIDKPQSGRFPRPDGTLDYKESVIREPVGNIREDSRSLAPGTGEQGNRGTDTSSSEIADAIPDPKNNRDDIDRVCGHLADRIQANGSKRPTITKGWRDAARLMIDRDGRAEEQIHRCIDWCQDDEFWRSNILSMPKLREKYDQLRLKASEKKPEQQTTRDWRNHEEPPADILGDPDAYTQWVRDRARRTA
jgi:hypothetical protein